MLAPGGKPYPMRKHAVSQKRNPLPALVQLDGFESATVLEGIRVKLTDKVENILNIFKHLARSNEASRSVYSSLVPLKNRYHEQPQMPMNTSKQLQT